MESTIWIITAIIALFGLVLIAVLLKMVWTGDYSRFLDTKHDQSFVGPMRAPQRVSLDLGVAHFVKETADWATEAEREKAAQDLR